MTIAGEATTRYDDLPLAVWPAPRILKPGSEHAFRCKVRLDVGRLGRILARRPLEELVLTVGRSLRPQQHGNRIVRPLPSIMARPQRIVRTDLLGKFHRDDPSSWRSAYRRALRLIVRDMKRGNLEERMRAARRVGSLLALIADLERGKGGIRPALRRRVTRPVLLAMLREVLKDDSDAVRAEMIAALPEAPLDGRILSLLAPVIKDPSALVRFRIAELFGAAKTPGTEAAMASLAEDKDELVRLMARAPRTP